MPDTVVDVKKMKSTTMHTYLGISTDGTNYTRLVPIKDVPDFGGEPNKVDVTTLEDEVETSLLGIQQLDTLPFTCNYVPEDYDVVAKLADGTIRKFCVALGKTGEYGIWTWEGQIVCWLSGGGVNAAREFKISISASTKVTKTASAKFTVGAAAA